VSLLLLTEFINLKIKLVQSFQYTTYKNRMCIYIFIKINNIYISIYLKKIDPPAPNTPEPLFSSSL
jgi:hypothetical protein